MSILDCFVELIAYSLYLMQHISKTQPSYEEVFDKANELINSAQKLASTNKKLADSFERSLFAICAWLDEQVVLSDWQQKAVWQQNPLQKQYFKTTQAGDQFYEILERFDLVLDKDIIEIYKLCIKLGFQGKLFYSQTNLEVIENSNTKKLQYIDYSEFNESEIFSFAYGNELDTSKKRYQISINLVMLIIAIMSICGIGLVVFIYDMLLEHQMVGYFK